MKPRPDWVWVPEASITAGQGVRGSLSRRSQTLVLRCSCTAFPDVKAKYKWLSVNTVPTAPRMSQSPGTPTINPAAPVAGSPASYPLGRTELPRCPRLRRSKVDRHREELNFQPLSQATYRSAFPEDRLLAPPAPSETIRPQSPLTVDPLDNSQRHLIRRLLSEQLPSQWPSGTLSCAQRMLMASSL